MKNQTPIWPGWDTGSCIGRGGFGSVYEIRRDVYGYQEICALKVITIPQEASEINDLRCSGADDASISHALHSQVEQILAEYTLLSRLRGNPHILHVDDFRELRHSADPGWDILIKMELLTPLMKALDRLDSEEAVIRLAMDLCSALESCRKHSIIHRDIKPQNIFLTADGHCKLGDFGIARVLDHKTYATMGIGTYSYMAPEVMSGKPYDHTADIYSLGLVLYWLLNNRRGPFLPLPPAVPTHSDNENARVLRRDGAPLPAPVNGSDKLVQIILKACAHDPRNRFRTPQEMRDALRAIPTEEFTVIPTPPQSDPDEDPTRLDVSRTPVIPDPEPDPEPISEPEPEPEYEINGLTIRGSTLIGYSADPENAAIPKDMWLQNIGREVFAGSMQLKTVQLPQRLKSIAYGAFRDCPALETVVFPDGMETIGDAAFRNCTGLKRLQLPNGLVTVGINAFSSCSSLEQLRLPKSLRTIDGGCFMDCRKLTTLSLPEGLVQICESAFCRTGITQLLFPKSLRQLGDYAFGYCGELKKAVFQPGITELDLSAFCHCRNLKTITIPDTVETLLPSVAPPANRVEIRASSRWIDAHEDFFYRNPHYIPVKSDSLSSVTRKFRSTVSSPTAAAFLTQWQKLSKKEKLYFLWGILNLVLILLAFLISDIYALCNPDCGAMILTYPLPILALQLLSPWGLICGLWIVWKKNPSLSGIKGTLIAIVILLSLLVLFMAMLFSCAFLDSLFWIMLGVTLSAYAFCLLSGTAGIKTVKNPPCTLNNTSIFLPNHEGKSARGLSYQMHSPVTGCIGLNLEVSIPKLNRGNPDGTWQLHVRDRHGKWRHLGYFEVKNNRGKFAPHFDNPISFDAYACTAYKTAPWNGTMAADLRFVTCLIEEKT